MRVRTATNDDAKSVLELAAMMAISFTVEPAAFRRSFEAVLSAASTQLLVGEDDGQICGYLLGFERARARGCRLIALATTRAGAFYDALGFENRADYYRKVL